MIAEVHRNTKSRRQPFKITDFLPFRLPNAGDQGGARLDNAQKLRDWAIAMRAIQEGLAAKRGKKG